MWLRLDLQMIQDADLDEGVPSDTLTMSWTDQSTSFPDPENPHEPVDHTILYALSGTNLMRTYDSTPRVVGRNITAIEFTRNGDYVNVAVSATGPGIIGRTQTLGFSVYVKTRTEM